MGLLRCEGRFAMPVPEGWTATGVPGDHYVLLPPDGQIGELRLVVQSRPATPLAEHEGLDRLEELLDELDVDREDVFVRERAASLSHRVYAWFEALDEHGRDVDCLAAVVVWPGGLVAATALASPRRPSVLSAAELMVASLAPTTPVG